MVTTANTYEITSGFRQAGSPDRPARVAGSVKVMSPRVTWTSEAVGASIVRLSRGILSFPKGTAIPGREHLVLSRSIEAETEATPDGFVIRSGAAGEEGYGATYDEACVDFLTSLRDRCDSLARREDRLSAEDRSVLERLRMLLGLAQGRSHEGS